MSCEWTVAELELASLAIAFGGLEAGGSLSAAEARLAEAAATRPPPARRDVLETAEQVRVGDDPLGDRLVSVRPPSERRTLGQVLTPASIAAPMVEWVLDRRASRVVDASNGSGRFTLGIARRSAAEVIAVDADPLATLLTRAGIAARGCDRRASVLNADYLRLALPPHEGVTAFIGNPPYVRHHDIPAGVKTWGRTAASRAGVPLSGLAGLHAYFFLATALHGRPGDVGLPTSHSAKMPRFRLSTRFPTAHR